MSTRHYQIDFYRSRNKKRVWQVHLPKYINFFGHRGKKEGSRPPAENFMELERIIDSKKRVRLYLTILP